jgi:hypothetical protein
MIHCPSCHASLAADALFCGVCGHSLRAAARPDPYQAMIGRDIAGRYRILAKLGEGGMGAVFRAEQISLKRTVALKLLRPELSADAELVRRFNAEAELAARLSHPNTVTLYDFGQERDGTLFIAMELIAGRSLRDVLAKDGPLPAVRIVHICEQLCSSLADAHAHGIVHRDLKPDNVMLSVRGKHTDVVRVLDFGIAKLRDQRGDVTGMPVTQAGALLGTPQYMAPEQIRGEAVDSRTDIYALGVILYEMATGTPPFQATALMAMLSAHLVDTPVPPSRRRPDLAISPELDAIIMAALQKDPAARPGSMEQLNDMLASVSCRLDTADPFRSVATGQDMTAAAQVPTPAPLSTPAAMYMATPMSAQGAAAHAVAMLATPPPGQVSGPAPMSMKPAPRPSHLGLWLSLGAVAIAAAAVAVALMMRNARGPGSSQDAPVAAGDPDSPTSAVSDTPVVSSDFFVPPKRKLYTDDQPNASAAAGASTRASNRYVNPSYGYGLNLPEGFSEAPTGDSTFTRFVNLSGAGPAVIAVAHVDFDPRTFHDQALIGTAEILAATAGGKLVDTSFRKVQGARRLTGIVDDPQNGLRFEFAILPCKDQGMVVMYGTLTSEFVKSRALRRELFEERVTIP